MIWAQLWPTQSPDTLMVSSLSPWLRALRPRNSLSQKAPIRSHMARATNNFSHITLKLDKISGFFWTAIHLRNIEIRVPLHPDSKLRCLALEVKLLKGHLGAASPYFTGSSITSVAKTQGCFETCCDWGPQPRKHQETGHKVTNCNCLKIGFGRKRKVWKEELLGFVPWHRDRLPSWPSWLLLALVTWRRPGELFGWSGAGSWDHTGWLKDASGRCCLFPTDWFTFDVRICL